MIQSQTLPIYKAWLLNASQDEIQKVDQVYSMAESLYEKGGDEIVECFSPKDILETFENQEDIKAFLGLTIEKRLNARWGEDSDPELSLA